ncbi:hypothetical protein BK125_20825 [Paenibacillus odorifer]|nr:hypothetical protein [Paenibacillus odorifer]OMC74247.1 hypothetical protein BK125_20825 [Paenibacillus odorifer]
MIQTDHLQYRYVQRVLGIEGRENIRDYLDKNFYQVYFDIDNAFKKSVLITENWPRFRNHEQFDCYLYNNRYIFSLDSQTKEGRTIIETKYGDDVSHLIKDIHRVNLEIKNINKQKEEQDSLSRKIEWTTKYLVNESKYQSDLKDKSDNSINTSVSMIKVLKQLKENRNYLIEDLIKRK